jgi:hypothetical protein
MARVELRELKGHGKTRRLEVTEVDVDASDSEACVDLLRRMAKQHDRKAGDCELRVKPGRKAEQTYRV